MVQVEPTEQAVPTVLREQMAQVERMEPMEHQAQMVLAEPMEHQVLTVLRAHQEQMAHQVLVGQMVHQVVQEQMELQELTAPVVQMERQEVVEHHQVLVEEHMKFYAQMVREV
jgi:hypothetical protein